MSGNPSAIVIGGGLSGLSAAWNLARAGHSVVVLERRPSPGGRASSTVDAQSREPVDSGQHVFMGCYRALRRWFSRLERAPRLRFQRRLRVPYALPGGKAVSFRALPLPAPLHLLGGLMIMPDLTIGERLGVFRMTGDVYLRPGRRMDSITVDEWERRRRLSPAVREYVIDPLVLAAANLPPNACSALPFLNTLRTLAQTGNPGSAIGFATTGLADLYVPGAQRAIEAAGGAVRTSAWAARIVVRDGRAAGVELADGEVLEAPIVVAAVAPWDLVALVKGIAVLDPLARAAARFRASPILTQHLWWDATIMKGDFAGLPGGPFQWVFNRTSIVGPGASGGQHVALVRSGADELIGRPPDDLAALAADDLRSRWPDARSARVIRGRTVWETKATVSLVPGTDPLRPRAATAVAGFAVAGDWTATGIPATMEGAVRSGESAATAALKSAGT